MVRGFAADDFAEGASANVTDVLRSRSAASSPSAERAEVGDDAPPDRSLAICEIRLESGRRSEIAFAVCCASSVAASCASAAAAASAAATSSSSESLLSKAGGSAPSADVPAPSAKVETLPDESFDVINDAFGVEPRFAPTKDDFERSSTPAAASSAARGVDERKLFDREVLPSSAAAASAAAAAAGASGRAASRSAWRARRRRRRTPARRRTWSLGCAAPAARRERTAARRTRPPAEAE